MRLPVARMTFAALIAVLAELAAVGLTATAAWLIVSAAAQPPLAALTVAIVIVRTLAIARGGLRYAERLAGHSAVLRAMADLRGQVYAALLRRKDIREGDALTRVVSDVDALQDGLLRCVVPACVAAMVAAIGLTVAAVMSLTALVVLLCALAISGLLLPLVAARLAARTARRTVQDRARLADHMLDLIHGWAELEVYGARTAKLTQAEATAASIAAVERRPGAFIGALGVAVQIGAVFALITLLPAGPGTAALALGTLTAMEVFLPLASAAARWTEVRPAIARVHALFSEPGTPPRPAPEVVLDLRPGKHIAIVGPSGAGKSTLLTEIARNEPIARGAMADGHIFATTIRENLSFARPDCTQDDLDRVARLARLDSWLASLPQGWNTVIDADTVSGGQRQRLLLARALLADAPIVLLDEPVESLDTTQGDEILADVLAATKDRAVVLVTHRLSHLAGFQDVVVLEDGRVVQRGSHEDLVGREGYYQDSSRAEEMISTLANSRHTTALTCENDSDLDHITT
ncbi:amino acid ABC transporter ATP-binding/permease protein [Kibdelosporangium aridum]|uniref:ATP-binding cassette, subfamily C, CydC n=1 Tax=Kibdelosporangium aridum TaxID=2030 RepID=A0A1W2F262_KIBAR|nr:ATP-binding cassette domain-containing protein [Kibdelosporangium aridum]SMD15984.1 ATP-binding cassette, subfamily C, CydC [Kibdelosporangium aridum]